MHTDTEKRLVKEAKGHRCSQLSIFSYERSNFFPFLSIKHKTVCHTAK